MVNINLASRTKVETVGKKYEKPFMHQVVNTLQGGMEQYNQIKDQNEKARINSDMTNMNIDLMKATEQYKVDYANDPNSKEGAANLSDMYKNITDQYAGNYSGKYRNEFINSANGLIGKYRYNNEAWGIQQNQVNTSNQINNSIKTSLNEAYMTGKIGDVNLSAINFDQYTSSLRELGNSVIGEAETAKLLANYESDYVKSAMTGVIDSNPANAMNLLQREDIVARLNDPKDLAELRKAAEARFKGQAEAQEVGELANFSLKYADKYNKAISGDMSSAEAFEFVHGEGRDLSGNAKKTLLKMSGLEVDKETGSVKKDPLAIARGEGELSSEFLSIGEFTSKDGGKQSPKLSKKASVEKMLAFQDKLYEAYANKDISKSFFNTYNNIMMIPLEKKLANSVKKNNWFANQTLEDGFDSINEATNYLGSFLGDEDTIGATEFIAAGLGGTNQQTKDYAAMKKEQATKNLYSDKNRADLANTFYRTLENLIRNDTQGAMGIVDMKEINDEKKSAFLMNAAVEARNSFVKAKYPELAKQANMPEAVYEKGKGFMYAMMNSEADRFAKSSLSSNQKVLRNPNTGEIAIFEINPNSGVKRRIRDLTEFERASYYGK